MKISPRAILLVIIFIVIVPLLPLLITQRWDWWQAWVYAIICILGFVVSRALVARRNPDLIAERSQYMEQEGTKSWDKRLSPLVSLGGALVPLAAGLEALLGRVLAFSLPITVLALVIFLAGYTLATYALYENRFFSGTVRIQTERGHHVVSSGPYRWMRHPGYAGALLSYLASPLLLDSCWAFLPAVLLALVLIIRTRLEDRTLQEELPGYRDYAARVRYRLLPGVW
jgi:protein-S-isoprenylcysteine O-methyltransferase Ste14